MYYAARLNTEASLVALPPLAYPPFSNFSYSSLSHLLSLTTWLSPAASFVELPPPACPPSSNFSFPLLITSLLSNYLALTAVSSFSLRAVHLSTASSLVVLLPPTCPSSKQVLQLFSTSNCLALARISFFSLLSSFIMPSYPLFKCSVNKIGSILLSTPYANY